MNPWYSAKTQLPDRPEVRDTIGWIYYRKHLAALAIPEFRASVETDPRNPVYHYHLGLAYASTGESEQSRLALSRALSIRSDFEGATEARRLLAQTGN